MQTLLDIVSCTDLESLDLGHNNISNFDGIGHFGKLQDLCMDSNPLKSLLVLRPLSILPHLQTLSLGGTPLTTKIPALQLKAILRNLLPGRASL